MKKSYLSWNKDTVNDVILSIYMNYRTASSTTPEHRRVTNTTDLLRTISEFRIKSLHRGNLKFKVTKIQKTGVKTYSKNNKTKIGCCNLKRSLCRCCEQN
jgi:hypothetical protein